MLQRQGLCLRFSGSRAVQGSGFGLGFKGSSSSGLQIRKLGDGILAMCCIVPKPLNPKPSKPSKP